MNKPLILADVLRGDKGFSKGNEDALIDIPHIVGKPEKKKVVSTESTEEEPVATPKKTRTRKTKNSDSVQE